MHLNFTPQNTVPEDMTVSIQSKVLSDWHSLAQLSQKISSNSNWRKKKLSRFPLVMLEMTELGHSNLIFPADPLLIRTVKAQ